MAAVSVDKYWTSVWARTTESVDPLGLIKMAEMNTTRSHVLNCEVYKMLAMKLDELRSTVVGIEDIDALCSKNKVIRARLAIVEDARAQAVFQLTKSQTIEMMCADAQRKGELKLKVFKDMTYAKHKELTEVLIELSKANELLAKLGVPSHADSRGSVETHES
ncbi:hypothetical protein Fot_22335 [Forsythia ovata]|uniref:Uncharacterized protein n=1 Tax=Forsythia ovata TaxID=205694 RepID=A0ABD1UXF6_9LAMI